MYTAETFSVGSESDRTAATVLTRFSDLPEEGKHSTALFQHGLQQRTVQLKTSVKKRQTVSHGTDWLKGVLKTVHRVDLVELNPKQNGKTKVTQARRHYLITTYTNTSYPT